MMPMIPTKTMPATPTRYTVLTVAIPTVPTLVPTMYAVDDTDGSDNTNTDRTDPDNTNTAINGTGGIDVEHSDTESMRYRQQPIPTTTIPTAFPQESTGTKAQVGTGLDP